MALDWKELINGVSDINADHLNILANAIKEIEEYIKNSGTGEIPEEYKDILDKVFKDVDMDSDIDAYLDVLDANWVQLKSGLTFPTEEDFSKISYGSGASQVTLQEILDKLNNETLKIQSAEKKYIGSPIVIEKGEKISFKDITIPDGELVSVTGRNIWDEEWSVKSGILGNKNPIPVLPNTKYYFGSAPNPATSGSNYAPSNGLKEYGSDGKTVLKTHYSEGAFTTSSDTHFIGFQFGKGYGSVYKNDLCINIFDSEFNGQYEPYKCNYIVSDKEAFTAINPLNGGLVIANSSGTEMTVTVEVDITESVTELFDKTKTSVINELKEPDFNGNMSIKAFREYRFSDGTLPISKQILWVDKNNDFYISENVYYDRKWLFKWDINTAGGRTPDLYSAVILNDGSILFVMATQFAPSATVDNVTPSDNYRRNPVLYSAINNYMPQVIDFGDRLKPTGWLQNVGVLHSARHNCLFIAEYTRKNEAKARIWRVKYPVTNTDNWSVVFEKNIPTPYGTDFKHFHTIQEDPYNDVLYFTSGDSATSSGVWYSMDGGLTFTQLDTYSQEKYRMLNMIFLEDCIYWASDELAPMHTLWRATRGENGVLDSNSIMKLASFEEENIATYATVYMSDYNILVLLDRVDLVNSGQKPTMPIHIYDIIENKVYTAGEISTADLALYGNIGFRNETVSLYPLDNKIIVGYGNQYKNYNKLLGNIGRSTFNTQINNLVLHVSKNSNGYKIKYETV